jgi:hypothetical protein
VSGTYRAAFEPAVAPNCNAQRHGLPSAATAEAGVIGLGQDVGERGTGPSGYTYLCVTAKCTKARTLAALWGACYPNGRGNHYGPIGLNGHKRRGGRRVKS